MGRPRSSLGVGTTSKRRRRIRPLSTTPASFCRINPGSPSPCSSGRGTRMLEPSLGTSEVVGVIVSGHERRRKLLEREVEVGRPSHPGHVDCCSQAVGPRGGSLRWRLQRTCSISRSQSDGQSTVVRRSALEQSRPALRRSLDVHVVRLDESTALRGPHVELPASRSK